MTTRKTIKKTNSNPSHEADFRAALERIHQLGGQQGAIAADALKKANMADQAAG